MKLVCNNIDQLKDIAKKILNKYSVERKFLFFGDLGAGKTTLIKELSLQLGVLDNVSSPTFSIVNEYTSEKYGKIYHFDFYRLNNEYEAFDLGCEEYFLSNNYCFVEWPEKVNIFLNKNMVKINISVKSNTRLIEILN
tara:strand:+ start:9839 stop:10252 length:414 start_codon:yes stop_codon:yes gene_type:complete